MTRIEIWKGKSSWYAMSLDERRDLIHRLAFVLENPRNQPSHGDPGPYLVHKKGNDLLVWSTEIGENAASAQYQEIRLPDFFEPLAYMSASECTNAKMVAMKLSKYWSDNL